MGVSYNRPVGYQRDSVTVTPVLRATGFTCFAELLSALVAGLADLVHASVYEMLFVLAAGLAGYYDHFHSVGVLTAVGQHVQFDTSFGALPGIAGRFLPGFCVMLIENEGGW